MGGFLVRPKFTLYYQHSEIDSYKLRVDETRSGGLSGTITVPDDNFDYGVGEFSLELSRLFGEAGGFRYLPFVRGGVAYEFERPNDGKLLTPGLREKTPTPWSGNTQFGIRALLGESVVIDVEVGYDGFGRSNYDAWTGRAAISIFLN